MTINNSKLSKHVVKTCDTNLGKVYFFNSLVISEFNEGVHVSYQTTKELVKLIKDYFGNSKPFGLISNMVNSYSIAPMDSILFKDTLKNLKAYGVVSYNQAGRLNAEIENNFCKNENICFDNIYNAANSIYDKVKYLTI